MMIIENVKERESESDLKRNFKLFSLVVNYNGNKESIQIKRYGNTDLEKMNQLLSDCENPIDLFWLDDSKYDSLQKINEFKEKFGIDIGKECL